MFLNLTYRYVFIATNTVFRRLDFSVIWNDYENGAQLLLTIDKLALVNIAQWFSEI